jgi:hypothetical protein
MMLAFFILTVERKSNEIAMKYLWDRRKVEQDKIGVGFKFYRSCNRRFKNFYDGKGRN